ncbi:MAG: polysaccharide biosynthesis tyrosine autokinase, partial [Acidobacteriaceae bacterium]|nr:polysaccharide biosynthesis tyrosine autokinase [Acidobacteriaceae bacterium]
MGAEPTTNAELTVRSLAPPSRPMAELSDPELITFRDLFRPLRVEWRLIVAATLTAILAAVVLGLIQKPVYQATAQLEVQEPNSDVLNMRTANAVPSENAIEPYLQTQVRIIQSYALLQRAADKLQLGRYREFNPRPSRFSHWPILNRFVRATPSGEQAVLQVLANHVSVRAVDQTHVIEITCRSVDPRLARDLANTISAEFISQTLARRIQNTQNTTHWLADQLQELKTNLEQSEDALQAYARDAGLIFPDPSDTGNVDEAKLRDLEQLLAKAQDERVAAEARYQRVTASPPDSLPDVLDDLTLRDYQVKLTDLKREAADLGSTLAPGHYKVKEVQAQIAVLEGASARRQADLIERIKTQYEAAQTREKLLASAYAAQSGVVTHQSAKTVRYDMLKREVDSNRALYEAILQRVKEAGVASAIRTTNVQVIDAARIPDFPAKPDLRLYSFAGLFAGAFAGVVMAFARSGDGLIHAPGRAMLRLQLPELGAIPDARLHGGGKVFEFGKHYDPALLPPPERRSELSLACWQDKDSSLAESIRTTLASVLFSRPYPPPQVLAITSPQSGDGKTTLASNFAILLAGTGRRVLLVDANLRSPRLHLIFNVPNAKGLTSLLLQFGSDAAGSIKGLIQSTKVPGLSVLPVGPRRADAMDRLYSDHLQELFDRLRNDFDVIIIDAAPLLYTDSRPVARVADGVVLVLRAGQAGSDPTSAVQRLAGDGTVIL